MFILIITRKDILKLFMVLTVQILRGKTDLIVCKNQTGISVLLDWLKNSKKSRFKFYCALITWPNQDKSMQNFSIFYQKPPYFWINGF